MNSVQPSELVEESPFARFQTFCRTSKPGSVAEATRQSRVDTLGYIGKSLEFKNYSICKTSPEALAKHGVGLCLYFEFVKQLSYLFLILSILSIYPIVSNSVGDGFPINLQYQTYVYLTVANQYGPHAFETDLETAKRKLPDIEDNLKKLWVIDYIASIFFLSFIVYYLIKSKGLVLKSINDGLAVEDFAICVEGYPEMITENLVFDYFSRYGDVCQVYLSRKYEGKLLKYKEVYEMCDRIGIRERDHQNKKRRTVNILTNAIDKFDYKFALDKRHDELPVDKAFVIFNTIEAKRKCLKDVIKQKKKCWGRKTIGRRKYSILNIDLQVKPASNPGDILWENLEYSAFDKFKVRALAFMLTSMFILLSFGVIFGIKAYFGSFPSDSDCKYKKIEDSMTIDEAKTTLIKEQDIDCFCMRQSLDDLLHDSQYSNFCKKYVQHLTENMLIKLSSGVCIVLINSLLKFFINKISKYEKFSHLTKKRLHILSRIFLMLFFNTALTTLMANARIYGKDLGITKGKYDDLNREWYSDIGGTITMTMLLSIFAPHCWYLCVVFPYNRIKRICRIKRFNSQYELNKYFRGMNFDISDSLSQILTVVFTCFMYSGPIPLLNIVCFFAMIITYWTNKVLIFRYYRRPPCYDADINERAIKFLPLAVVFHCIISFYAFTNPDIFPKDFIIDQTTGYVIPQSESLGQRISTGVGIANLLLMTVALVMFIIILITPRDFQSIKVNKVLAGDPDSEFRFEDYKKNFQNECVLCSYDIMENPKYSKLIIALNSSAKRVREKKTMSTFKSNSSVLPTCESPMSKHTNPTTTPMIGREALPEFKFDNYEKDNEEVKDCDYSNDSPNDSPNGNSNVGIIVTKSSSDEIKKSFAEPIEIRRSIVSPVKIPILNPYELVSRLKIPESPSADQSSDNSENAEPLNISLASSQ